MYFGITAIQGHPAFVIVGTPGYRTQLKDLQSNVTDQVVRVKNRNESDFTYSFHDGDALTRDWRISNTRAMNNNDVRSVVEWKVGGGEVLRDAWG